MKTVVVVNPDDSFKSQGRVSRWMLDRAVERTALFVPFSNYTAARMIQMHPEIADRLIPMHPGLPLDRWPMRTPPSRGDHFRLLFVGSLVLVGIDWLLHHVRRRLHASCDLDIAAQTGYLSDDLRARLESTQGVRLHLDLEPGSPELQLLLQPGWRRSCYPPEVTSRRGSPSKRWRRGCRWSSPTWGGYPTSILDGETGLLIRPDQPDDIVAAVRRLESSPELVERLIRQARAHVKRRSTSR